METRPVNIAETIVYGVVFDPKNNDRVKNMDIRDLFDSVGKLFDLLKERQVDFVLVGGIAMLAYVEARNTQDIDIILSRKDLAKLPELKIDDDNLDFARTMLDELRVDVLFTRNKLFKLIASKFSVTQKFGEREVPCATVEGLVALKLFALPSLYRQGRFEKTDLYESDIVSLLRKYDISQEKLFKTLEPVLLPSDLTTLEEVMQDLEKRIAKSHAKRDKQ